MSLPATVAPAIMDTILGRLALLFETGAKGDALVAWNAASQMLSAYHAETEDELGLAADIISCRFQLLAALSYAAAPDLPLNKVLRLRGGAVSLSREGHKRSGSWISFSGIGERVCPEASQTWCK